jgi:NADP-dependent 3-hydroxy acid dehydrogenase YdfG
MARLPGEIVDEHGSCHILVNNAGVLSVGPFADDRLDDIRWIVGVNIYGVVHGCHSFLPLLHDADGGSC